jgi:ribosomal protein L22
MTKITQSYLLRCGFTYNSVKAIRECYKKKYQKLNRSYKNIWNVFYTKNIWLYDAELDGEIELKILCFKTFGSWAFNINNTVTSIPTTEELEQLLEINENENLNFVYIIESQHGFKIGRTKNIDDRGSIFNVKLPFDWHFYNVFAVRKSKKIEKFLHFVLQNYHKNGEWFQLEHQDLPIIECFIINNNN